MHGLTVFLFLGAVGIAYAETCPSVDHMRPCVCQSYHGDITVRCSADEEKYSLWEIEPAIMSLEGKKKITIKMDGINLGKVPTELFVGVGAESLSIDDCELDSLFGEPELVLTGLEDTLEHLEIYSSFKNDYNGTRLRLGHLQKLKYLAITNNNIKELGDDLFEEEPVPLETVTMDYNGITKLGNNIFAHLSNLKDVFLDGNEISLIHRSMFPWPAEYLESMYFMYNNISDLPKDMFKKMFQLRRVSFAFNRLTKLEQDTWDSVWKQLNYVNLTGNPLECDSHMDWMFDLRTPAITDGTCISPEEKKGTKLIDFIKSRGQ